MTIRVKTVAGLLCAGLFWTACNRPPAAEQTVSASTQPPPASPTPLPAASPMPASAGALKVDGAKALYYARQMVALGPRPVGTPAHAKLEQLIKSNLKGLPVSDEAFDIQAPVGKFTGHNLIAKFPGKKDGIIVVAGHYETKSNIPNFVGANDGGSSAGLLLALADALRRHPNDGYSVWLLWNDAEEAFVSWTDTDSVYGARYQAGKWKLDGTAAKIKAFINIDMIGDADLNIEDDLESDEELRRVAYQAATNLGYQSHFFGRRMAVVDDHIQFKKAGIPVIDLIDFDYGYNNVFWHTAEDNIDKLSADSLKISGDTVLEMIRMLNAR